MGIPAKTRQNLIALASDKRDGDSLVTLMEMFYDLFTYDIIFTTSASTPVDGTSGTGAGVAGPGSKCFDREHKIWFNNTGTKADPVWSCEGLSTT